MFKNTAQARETVRRERTNYRAAKYEGNVQGMAEAQRKHNEAMSFLRGNGSAN